MRFTRPILGFTGALAALALAAPAAFAAPANHNPGPPKASGSGAVFAQTDNLSANAVVAYKRSPQGKLTQAGIYKTGGKGGALEGAKVDFLASQGSLALDSEAGLLFAVNAGSNTITTFAVNGDRLARRQVLPSGGQFPVSVAAHGNLVFVLKPSRDQYAPAKEVATYRVRVL